MKHTGFTEILPGIWYEESTGLPWSSKRGKWGNDGKLHKITSVNNGYYSIHYGKQCLLWHRVVYEYFRGNIPPDMDVDHMNNNRDNNRIENLQLLCRKDNASKRKMAKNNTSGFVGVTFRSDCKKYRACIKIGGKSKTLGYFLTPEEAYQSYLDAKVKYHGLESIKPLPM